LAVSNSLFFHKRAKKTLNNIEFYRDNIDSPSICVDKQEIFKPRIHTDGTWIFKSQNDKKILVRDNINSSKRRIDKSGFDK